MQMPAVATMLAELEAALPDFNFANAPLGLEFLTQFLTEIKAKVEDSVNGFKSTPQAITTAGALQLAHGLSYIPDRFMVLLQCVTAEGGYSIGDTFPAPFFFYDPTSVNEKGVSIVPDATYLNIRYANAGSVWIFLNKTTGANVAMTNTKWNAIFIAW